MEAHLNKSSGEADLSIKSAVNAGFSFIKHVDNDMFNMLGMYFIFSCVLGLLQSFVFYDASNYLFSIINAVLGIVIVTPLSMYVVQKMILGKQAGAYLGYYMESTFWKLLAASFLVFLIMLLPIGLLMYGGVLASSGGGSSLFLIGGGFILLMIGVYFGLRLSLITPHVVVHNSIDFGYVYNISKGLLLKIIALALICSVPIIIVSLVFVFLGLTHMQVVDGGQVSGQVLAQGVTQGMSLGGSLVNALIHGITTTVYAYLGFVPGAAIAHYYKEAVKLKGGLTH